MVSKPVQISELLDTITQQLGITLERSGFAEPGINYRDRGPSESPPDHKQLTSDGLAGLPLEWQQELHHAAVLGDDDAIFHLLECLPEHHKDIGDIIRYHATRYNFVPIIDAAGANLQT